MLKKLFRAMLLNSSASADIETQKTLSDRQLENMGLSKATFISEILKSVRKDLDTSEDNMSHRQIIHKIGDPNSAGSVQKHPTIT